jgi:hypothetical protein
MSWVYSTRMARSNEERFTVRLRRGLIAGFVIGGLLGGGLGLLIGMIAFRPGSAAMWALLIGGVLAGALLGGFEGGLARLESPEPGREPSQVEHPLRDVHELTSEEGDPPAAADEPSRGRG